MLINTKHLLATFLGFASHLALAQVTVNQLVGYASLNGGIPISGTTITVTSCAALKSALGSSSPQKVQISGTIADCPNIPVKSDKFILGVGATATLLRSSFRIVDAQRVIVRNIKFKPPPAGQDAITIEASTNVWVDHCYFESDLDHDEDYYDGLVDITHGSDYITISWCKFFNHWKGSLVGHSDNNGDEDIGKLRVTYHHNYWDNINSRTPSIRFGTGHVYSSCYYNLFDSGINSRMGAVVKIEQCYFENANNAIATDLYSAEVGYVHQLNNIFGPGTSTSITDTTFFTPPYPYWTTPASQVCSLTLASAGVGVVTTLP